jgi:hypothetical protein
MRDVLSYDNLHVLLKKQMENYYNDIVKEVASAISKNRVVLAGMKYNDFVYTARRSLKKLISFTVIWNMEVIFQNGEGAKL